jgi:hypothetical protein
MKKFLFIPVVNHFNLLEKAINSVPDGLFDEYFVFNNSGGDIPIDIKHFKLFDNVGRKTFRETQNIMRQYAIENACDYYCFMHNDGEVLDDTVQRLVAMAESQTEPWSVIFTHYDVLCAYSTECVKKIGLWGDFKWPKDQQNGYYLDNDYYRRMNLQWAKEQQLPNTNVLHTEYSNTIRNPVEQRLWETQIRYVENHYLKKWGGLPGREEYNEAFGGLLREN